MPSYRCLTPSKFRLRRHVFANIGSGSFQSFAIQEHGTVWGWGQIYTEKVGKSLDTLTRLATGSAFPPSRELFPPLTSKLDDFFDGAITPAGNAES